ncbi:MAG: secretin and TonB N-terminal domain-containing protein [Planctomycetes bacterium]|nr:secretin and TonB N-terminal domain-containing protein [Planctomycetota bacterium]
MFSWMSVLNVRKKLVVALVAGFCLFSACGLRAEDDGMPASEGVGKGAISRITVSYRRVPLERVLDYVSKASRGVNIKISVDDEAELEELKRMLVTVELTNVTWRTAVDYIANKYRFVVNDDEQANGIVLLERPPRVTLDVKNMDIANVIKLIATDAKVNIIIGPEIQGTVSFNIHDVPWKDALDSILKANGFIQVKEPSGIIRITTPERVAAQQIIKAVSLKYLQPGGTNYVPTLESDYVEKTKSTSSGASSAVSSLMTVLNQVKSADGSISYEQGTNTLVIKDTATQIEEMLDLIKQLDKEPLQVKINVRILERTYNDTHDAGINWSNGISGALVQGPEWQTTFPLTEENFTSERLGVFQPMFEAPYGPQALDEVAWLKDGFTWQSAPEAAEPISTYSLGTMSLASLQATLKIAQTNSDVKVVQAPEIVALDNQEATIHVGRIVRYAEFYVNTTDAGSESGYREVRPPITAGVQLIVVPHVCGTDNKVILEVVPKTEDFNDEWEVFGEGTANELRLPKTSKKIVVTKMMLKSQETGVIGGLINDTMTKTNSKVPVLGDIPVIGRAFRNNSSTKFKQNVMILITPTILGPQSADEFKDELEEVRNMAANLGGTDFIDADLE